jgi:xylulokinase
MVSRKTEGNCMTDYLLGIDVGTTGSKALLVGADGAVKASATTEYPMFTPQPLWAEQNPTDWWAATAASIRRVLGEGGVEPGQVVGVGLTGQMHGLVLLDGEGQVLRPCIMWNDQRTAAECAAITEKVGPQKVLQLTGNPVLPGFTAPKIAWVRGHEPGVYARVAKVLLPKDYVRYRLTGGFFSEVSDASGTSLFDVGGRQWSSEMLAALDLPRKWLPEVTESPEVSAHVSAGAAAETGLLASWAAAAIRRPRRWARASSTRASFRSRWARRVSSLRPRRPIGWSRRASCTPSVTPCRAPGT